MFSPIASLAPHLGRTRCTVAAKRRVPAAQRCAATAAEAYELRLLAEVARWDDEAAFAEIVAHHQAAVIAAAFEICRCPATAEDIAQQTFTALWVRAARITEKTIRVRPWLVTVARNAALDHARADRRRRAAEAAFAHARFA